MRVTCARVPGALRLVTARKRFFCTVRVICMLWGLAVRSREGRKRSNDHRRRQEGR